MARKASPAFPEGLGKRLRDLRLQAGMSLRALAAKSNLTASSISLIERGGSGGTSKTLFALANALGVPAGVFFEDDDASLQTVAQATVAGTETRWPRSPFEQQLDPASSGRRSDLASTIVVREADRRAIVMDGGAAPVVWQLLTADSHLDTEFLYVTYHPGASSCRRGTFMRHAGRDNALVLQGELTLYLGFEEVTLSRGDSVSFDATAPHRLENRGPVPSHSVWFVSHRGRE